MDKINYCSSFLNVSTSATQKKDMNYFCMFVLIMHSCENTEYRQINSSTGIDIK